MQSLNNFLRYRSLDSTLQFRMIVLQKQTRLDDWKLEPTSGIDVGQGWKDGSGRWRQDRQTDAGHNVLYHVYWPITNYFILLFDRLSCDVPRAGFLTGVITRQQKRHKRTTLFCGEVTNTFADSHTELTKSPQWVKHYRSYHTLWPVITCLFVCLNSWYLLLEYVSHTCQNGVFLLLWYLNIHLYEQTEHSHLTACLRADNRQHKKLSYLWANV